MKYGKPEEQAQKDIEALVDSLIGVASKIPVIGNFSIAKTFGVHKLARKIVIITQDYFEAKLNEKIDSEYTIQIVKKDKES